LEKGSGVTNLQRHIEDTLVTDYEYTKEIKKTRLEEKVEIRNKEHLYFYKIYRKFYRPPIDDQSTTITTTTAATTTIDKDTRKCPYCYSNFIWNGNFCKICGAFPVYFNDK
jgi:asparagine synthase (glutamine-hydrolysing)